MIPLESSKVFERLSPAEMEPVKQAMEERSFTTGQTIFKEGDAGDGIYLVKSGKVEISVVVGGQGERKVFAREGQGALFGEMAVIDNQPRSASATACEETVVYFLPREKLQAAMNGSPAFTTSLMQGITQRLREFNRQYIDEVLQTERLALVGRFTRSIVHDLKNPLNIIGIAADMATYEKSTQEMRDSSRERIRKQINRISSMVNEVVEFTRSTNTSFILALMDYDRLVSQVVEELKSEMSLRSVRLKMINDPPAIKLAVNPERLVRVFYNLFGNASEAMTDGGTISLEFALRDGKVFTTIADDGPGIPPEVAGRLFDAFVTHGKPNGTGLGLSICRRIIEDHRGEIWLENGRPGGAAFTFTLPVPASSQPGQE